MKDLEVVRFEPRDRTTLGIGDPHVDLDELYAQEVVEGRRLVSL